MTDWKYDPAAYTVGDTLWFRRREGWSNYTAVECRVKRKTPSGQIVAVFNNSEARINKHGVLAGGDSYSERVISPENAAELIEGSNERRRWQAMQQLCGVMESKARNMDVHGFGDAMSRLQQIYNNTPALHVEVL